MALPEGAHHCPKCGTSSRPPTNAGSTLMGTPMPAPPPPPSSVHEAPTQPSLRAVDPAGPGEKERFPPGTLLLRQYRTVCRLGEGGMGSVYLARDDLSGQEVAIKVLPAALSREADIRERFVQEARALAALDHPAIVPLVTFARDEDDHILVMKYVPGRSIEALLEEKGAFDIELARRVFRTVTEALGYAHERGVIHRDVKPANVLLSDDGKIFVVDFGISKRADSTRLTQTGMLMGTPQYMSPEQISGHPIDGRSDLYAAGLLLFEMLTGRPPFTGDKTFTILRQHVEAPVPDPRDIRKGEIPRGLLVILDALLKKDPDERPRDAAATLALLDQTFDETPAFGKSLTFFDEAPSQRSTPLTTSVPALDDDDLEDLALELRSKKRLRAALGSLLVGALVLFAALQLVPGWAGDIELESQPPPPPMPRIDPHDEAFTLLLRKAQKHLNEDQPRMAFAVLDVALTERPDDKTAMFLKARALVQSKRLKAARTTLDALAARSDLDEGDLALIENYRQHLQPASDKAARSTKRARGKQREDPAPSGAAADNEGGSEPRAHHSRSSSSAARESDEGHASPLTDRQLRVSAAATHRKARACYERHVLRKKGNVEKPSDGKSRADDESAVGIVVLEVEIQPNGRVTSVRSVEHTFAGSPELIKCLEGLARDWRFPGFEGAPIQFRYTYDLRPTL